MLIFALLKKNHSVDQRKFRNWDMVKNLCKGISESGQHDSLDLWYGGTRKERHFFTTTCHSGKMQTCCYPLWKHPGEDYFLMLVTSQRSIPEIFGITIMIMNISKLPLTDLEMRYNLCDIFCAPTRLEGIGHSRSQGLCETGDCNWLFGDSGDGCGQEE